MSRYSRTLLKASRFDVVEYEIPIKDGNPPIKRQIIEHPGAVVILPLVSREEICLIKNYRIAVGKTLIELPAGTIDRNEQPGKTAERELREETGYIAAQWRELPPFFMSPGILNERMHLYVAEGLTEGPPAREEAEEIENLVVPWEQALAMVDRGEIEDAKTLVAILLWNRLRNSNAT